MSYDRSFRFANDTLNGRLIGRLRDAGFDYAVSPGGEVRFHVADEEGFEDVLARVRDEVFPSWQVLSFPPGWADRYRAALVGRAVGFEEEVNNGAVEFLLAGTVDPHAWEIA